ncbi:MAG: nodulation protein NfeD [Chloroflexota bacterium]|nr:nodulation protein NfeD [Chloroflexota bacterium]
MAPLVLGLFGLAAGDLVRAADAGGVIVLPTTGIVDNVMAGYLADGIARGERDGAAAVVIQLNTPGGSLDATNHIVGTLLEANVPVIVWVAPSGGHAASAGTFITLAAHVALMAPGTRIGAASPVGGSGEDIPGTLGDKVRNDTIASIRAIAEARGRNVEWAIRTVDEAHASPASEAVAAGAVDGIAATLTEVLAFADGRVVKLGDGRTVTLDLGGAQTSELPMNPFQGFLHLLSDPNIAFILITIGFYGLLYEVISPNFVTGIIGALSVILAFIGFGSLPLNVAGLILIGLAIVLFLLELTVTSHGLLAVGGLVCLALGASALYTEPGVPGGPDIAVAFPLIVAMTITTALFMALAITTVVRTRRRLQTAPAGYGAGGSPKVPAGTPGEVRMSLDPIGSVYAAGEEWSARSTGPALEPGTPVVVVGQEGLTLIVEAADVERPAA